MAYVTYVSCGNGVSRYARICAGAGTHGEVVEQKVILS